MDTIVRDERELMAALNAPGRTLEYNPFDEEGKRVFHWVIREYSSGTGDREGEILGQVEDEFAWDWTGKHDYPDPLSGPFQFVWTIPEHRLPEWPRVEYDQP